MCVVQLIRAPATLGLLVTVLACEMPTGSPGGAAPDRPSMAISDGDHGGASGFYFLPPMTRQPGPFAGVFDATLAPVVRICRYVDDACADADIVLDGNGSGAQRLRVDEEGESYGVLWKETSELAIGDVYRLRVYADALATAALGYADLLIVARPKDEKEVPPGFIGLARGLPFHIRFRVEEDVQTEPEPEAAPIVIATTPADAETGFPRNASLGITFSEPVTLSGEWFDIVCTTTGTRTASATTVTGGPATFAIDPHVDFALGESCTVTVFATAVADQDVVDPPDNMAADHVFSFTVSPVLAPTPVADGPAPNSSPGDPYHGFVNVGLQVLPPAPTLLANDELGVPAGQLTSFGGGSLGGTAADHAAGTTVTFGDGGLLGVFANGAVAFVPSRDFTGEFTFQYRVTNVHGSGEATVTLLVGERKSGSM